MSPLNGSMDTTCSEFDGDISGLDNDYDNSVTPISSQIFREQTSTPRSRFQNHTGNVSNFARVFALLQQQQATIVQQGVMLKEALKTQTTKFETLEKNSNFGREI